MGATATGGGDAMARMIPETIWFERSLAERKVFEALRDALPGAYTVLHHVPWVQRQLQGGARDGEADFVVIHPDRGLLVLEVKGGGIRHEAASGRWFSVDRDGREHPLPASPFEQAMENKHNLRRWLEDRPGWRSRWGPFGHAVCFPDAVTGGEPLPHTPQEVLIDARDIADRERMQLRVEKAFDLWADGRRLGPERVQRAITALAHDVQIRQPLGLLVEETDREILKLSERQYGVLLTLGRLRRVAVSGPAGAGKTLIAAEKARRLASEGKRTLLTCFNRPLADFLRGSLARVADLDVWSYHQLCWRLGMEAHLQVPTQPHGDREWQAVEALLPSAVDRLGARYDALVVDEAQDFKPEWWLPLLMLLHELDQGIFYVFYDANQDIYGRPEGLPQVDHETHLFENFRNARPVFDHVMRFYRGPEVRCAGPDGPPILRREVRPGELRRELGRILHQVVNEGGLSPSDVVVLTPRALEASAVRGRVGAFHLTPTPQAHGDVKLSTIHRFKGLDAMAVIVCEVDGEVGRDSRALLYVACSRARSFLAVLTTR